MRWPALLLLASIALFPSTGRAVFHIAHISEIMVGAGGDPSVQYVEIRMDADTQNVVATTRLTTFSCDGTTKTVILDVPGNVPNGMNGQHWIMASPSGAAFLSASGINPDFTWDSNVAGNGIPTPCGQVCWGAPGLNAPAPPGNWDRTVPNNYVDCIAYGGYTGPTKTADPDNDLVSSSDGTPSASPPGDGTLSLTRVGSTNNNLADFTLDCPSPTNNNGDMGTFGACSPPTTTTTIATASTTTLAGATTTTTLARAARRSKCAARKFVASGKNAAAKLGCEATAAAKGASPNAACAARADAAFARAGKKAEARKDCLAPTGDADALRTVVDRFVAPLGATLAPTTQRSKCTSRKLRAAGAEARALGACEAHAFAKGVAVDAGCVATAGSKLRAAFAKAEKRGDCQAAIGDAARVAGDVDGFVAALLGALAP